MKKYQEYTLQKIYTGADLLNYLQNYEGDLSVLDVQKASGENLSMGFIETEVLSDGSVVYNLILGFKE